MSNSLQPHGLQPARLLCPWASPGKNTGVGCLCHLQGIFPTQGSNPGLLYCRRILFFFNWRIITLQYCDRFCHIATWISHRCSCVPPSWTTLPPPSPPHPSGFSQSTSFECPASCIKLALVIVLHSNVHVSMLFSHIIPPSPSPKESESLFFTSVSLLLPCT